MPRLSREPAALGTRRRAAESRVVLPRLPPTRRLTEDVIKRLTEEILNGSIEPGERLPTEQQLALSLGVSRTVVREAVAALRADGLVVTRQGVGAFVAFRQRRPFRIDADELTSLDKLLHVMELRTGIEIEAAGLAASRRTAPDLRQLASALDAIDAALDKNEDAVRADLQFHCAIADASHNPLFREFLQFLGEFIIPRQSVRVTTTSIEAQIAYLRTVQQEHRAISEAISQRDEDAARDAMRTHLHRSRDRYRTLRDKLERER
jgi:DNA-binding FadR family transcriptional regulator